MATPPPGIDLSEDRTAEIAFPDWIFLALATVAVGLRLYSRVFTKVSFWWDDLAAVIALVSSRRP